MALKETAGPDGDISGDFCCMPDVDGLLPSGVEQAEFSFCCLPDVDGLLPSGVAQAELSDDSTSDIGEYLRRDNLNL